MSRQGVTTKYRNKTKKHGPPKDENDEPLKYQALGNLFKKTLHSSVVILNLIALMWFGYQVYNALQVPEHYSMEIVSHGVRFLPFFFSFWVSGFQHLYFCMYAAIDVLEMLSGKRKDLHKVIQWLHSAASYLLFTIVFPLSLMIGILFWSMYFWDRATIYPEILERWAGQWPNHVMHTLPIPLSIVYMFVSNKKEPPKTITLSCLVAFIGVYSCLFFAIKSYSGKWVYLCLEYLPPTIVPPILAFAALSPLFFHSLGYKINDLLKSVKKNHPFLRCLSC